jgi:hypothetical protein
MDNEIELGTIDDACAVIGGKSKPVDRATYYRGVKAGRYNGPFHPSPGISRVDLTKLRAIVCGLAASSDEAA